MAVVSQSAKRCRKCGFIKPVILFPRNRHSSDGYRSRCKPCHAADVRQWTHAEPERLERVRHRAAEWKEQHPEQHRANERKRHRERWRDDPVFRRASREKWRRYRQKNAERCAAAYRKWVQDNPERARARNRRWAARHREKTRERAKAWRLTNPDKAKALWRASKSRRRARELGAPGTTPRAKLQARWDYFGGRCWICGGEANSIDHVIPLARGGSNWPSNLRPACLVCNTRKGAQHSPTSRTNAGIPPPAAWEVRRGEPRLVPGD
jgi:hypothetical protein